MKSVSMAELRRRLAHYLDRVEQGERIQVMRRGRVVATLAPGIAEDMAATERLEILRKQARIGDVVSPLDVEWEAADGPS